MICMYTWWMPGTDTMAHVCVDALADLDVDVYGFTDLAISCCR